MEPYQDLHGQIFMRDLCSSEIRGVEQQFLTDISGQPISPIFKDQEIQKETTEVEIKGDYVEK